MRIRKNTNYEERRFQGFKSLKNAVLSMLSTIEATRFERLDAPKYVENKGGTDAAFILYPHLYPTRIIHLNQSKIDTISP